ncbi:hypothetical protein ACOW8E_002365 [Enterobacter hormaechei]|uniref:hypothetical protein n=1 Tax=Enterobacter hormaechei TaxID=158836 RepID=UPI000793E6F2|nr:hypothetical protein [Enterobacter hormaechei]MCM7289713.1 hypothetical protein [Enterobacter hormaechei]CZW80927.1 Uncharacterised protein [Enterobacter hormaechei]SAG92764.1 Uncharacterised protein [Enterobacter hormaechei]
MVGGVINNKYYIDDVQSVAREIDIIAYKATKVRDVLVYTTLIISCKKNEENVWALLVKNIKPNDPNIDYEPLKNWSNHPVLNYELNFNNKEKIGVPDGIVYEKIFNVTKNVFAFQEMSKKSGRSNNDKNIFNSITSLMKAQSYELTSLSSRKKERSVYFFHLMSLIDSEMILLDCEGDEIHPSETESHTIISNYIINGESTASKINFMTLNGFLTNEIYYQKLHEYYVTYINKCFSNFYNDAFSNIDKRKILTKELWHKYGAKLSLEVMRGFKVYDRFSIDDIWPSDDSLIVEITTKSSQLNELLEGSEKIKEQLRIYIEDVFNMKVNKKIAFIDDIPF